MLNNLNLPLASLLILVAYFPAFGATCPNPFPEKPTGDELRACFAEVVTLRGDVQKLQATINQLQAMRSVAMNNVSSQRHLGLIYHNDRAGPRIVTISATRPGSGNTMRAYVSKTQDELYPSPVQVPVPINSATVASVSFGGPTFASVVTFVVPPGYYYNLSADGGDITVTDWIEVDL